MLPNHFQMIIASWEDYSEELGENDQSWEFILINLYNLYKYLWFSWSNFYEILQFDLIWTVKCFGMHQGTNVTMNQHGIFHKKSNVRIFSEHILCTNSYNNIL